MAIRLRDLAQKEELLTGGHRLCAGCGASIIVRQVLAAADTPVVIGSPTGCLEVATSIYPYTAWNAPWIHSAFENVAATMSGVEACYQSLKKQGKIDKDIRFIAFGGDGGTYDIGIQALSGMLERGHRVIYVCYDNQAYMNTGIQRSSATPKCAWTTTSPTGKVRPGKVQFKKDLTGIVAAHGPHIYAAQASPSHWRDLMTKAQKALSNDGPAFLNILAPCPRGWRFSEDRTIEIARVAVSTRFWPLYEVEGGKWHITYKPKERKLVEEWLKLQGRFRHLTAKPENSHLIEELQAKIDANWAALEKREEITG